MTETKKLVNASLYSADETNPDRPGKEMGVLWAGATTIAACDSLLKISPEALAQLQNEVLPAVHKMVEDILSDPAKVMASRAAIAMAYADYHTTASMADRHNVTERASIAQKYEVLAMGYLKELKPTAKQVKEQEARKRHAEYQARREIWDARKLQLQKEESMALGAVCNKTGSQADYQAAKKAYWEFLNTNP